MPRILLSILLLLCMVTPAGLSAAGASNTQDSTDIAPEPIVAGYVEQVSITIDDLTAPIVMEAKLDTGADSSSMHVTDIELHEKSKTVSFTVRDHKKRKQRITCKYDRIVKIKKRPYGYQRRAVIPVKMQIGQRSFDAFVNLADRSNFAYRMLIGRRVLRHGFLVDSSRHHLLELPTTAQ